MPIRLTEERKCWIHGTAIHVNNKCQKCASEKQYEIDETEQIEQYLSDRVVLDRVVV